MELFLTVVRGYTMNDKGGHTSRLPGCGTREYCHSYKSGEEDKHQPFSVEELPP